MIIWLKQTYNNNTKKNVRRPGIEPGSKEWESSMIPLHQRRFDYKWTYLGVIPGTRVWAIILSNI